MKKPVKTTLKVKKKKWCPILAPQLFNEQLLGESYVEDKKLLLGRHIGCNLMSLTQDPKKQIINVDFKIDKLVGDNVGTILVKYEMVPSAIKRMVRRKRDRIDESLLCLTADNAEVRVKPLLLTKNSTTNSVITDLRSKLKKNVVKAVKSMSYEALVRSIISGKLKKDIKDKLHKVYPLAVCEIRSLVLKKEPSFTVIDEKNEEKPEDTTQEAKPEPKTKKEPDNKETLDEEETEDDEEDLTEE